MLPQPQPPLSAASPPPSLNPSTAYTNTLKTVEELTNEVTRLRIQVKGLERASQIKEHGYEQQIETLKKVISIIEIERDEYRELLEASVYAPPSDESGTLSPTSVKAESQDDTVTANPVPESKPPTVSLEVRPSKDMLPAAPISAADAGLDLKRHPSSSMGPQAKRVQSQKLNANVHHSSPPTNEVNGAAQIPPVMPQAPIDHMAMGVQKPNVPYMPVPPTSMPRNNQVYGSTYFNGSTICPQQFSMGAGCYTGPYNDPGLTITPNTFGHPLDREGLQHSPELLGHNIVSPVPIPLAHFNPIIQYGNNGQPLRMETSPEAVYSSSPTSELQNDSGDELRDRLEHKRRAAEKLEEERIRSEYPQYPTLIPGLAQPMPSASLLDGPATPVESVSPPPKMASPLKPTAPIFVPSFLKNTTASPIPSVQEDQQSSSVPSGDSDASISSSAKSPKDPRPSRRANEIDSPERNNRMTKATGVEATKRIINIGISQALAKPSPMRTIKNEEPSVVPVRARRVPGNYDKIREVSIRKLPRATSVTTVLDHVKTGQIDRVLMNWDDREIRIFFVEPQAARTCHEYLKKNGVWIDNMTMATLNAFLWNNDSAPMAPELSAAVYDKRATRVLWLGNLPRPCRAGDLANDCKNEIEGYGPDIIDNVMVVGSSAEVRFTSVEYCLQARQNLRKKRAYRDTEMFFGPDPCGEVAGRPPRNIPLYFIKLVPKDYRGQILSDSESDDLESEAEDEESNVEDDNIKQPRIEKVKADETKIEKSKADVHKAEDPKGKAPKAEETANTEKEPEKAPEPVWHINFRYVPPPTYPTYPGPEGSAGPRKSPGLAPHEKNRGALRKTPTLVQSKASTPIPPKTVSPPTAPRLMKMATGPRTLKTVVPVKQQPPRASPQQRVPQAHRQNKPPHSRDTFVFKGKAPVLSSSSATSSTNPISKPIWNWVTNAYPQKATNRAKDMCPPNEILNTPTPAPPPIQRPRPSPTPSDPNEQNYLARTVHVTNLPPDVSLFRLLSFVRGGPVDSVALSASGESAIIVFLHTTAAQAFRLFLVDNNVTLDGKRISSDMNLPRLAGMRLFSPEKAERDGLSRCLVIEGLPRGVNLDGVKRGILNAMDKTEDELTMERMWVTGDAAYTFFASIADAVWFRNALMRKKMWIGSCVCFVKDPCAGPFSSIEEEK